MSECSSINIKLLFLEQVFHTPTSKQTLTSIVPTLNLSTKNDCKNKRFIFQVFSTTVQYTKIDCFFFILDANKFTRKNCELHMLFFAPKLSCSQNLSCLYQNMLNLSHFKILLFLRMFTIYSRHFIS
jgi:hypothetical protein